MVDLLQHRGSSGVPLAEMEDELVATIREGRWDRDRLRTMTFVHQDADFDSLIQIVARRTGIAAALIEKDCSR